MNRLLQIGCIMALGSVAVVAGRAGKNAASDDEAARAAAIKLFQSLTDAQKQLALKDINDKERYVEQFPPVERPGLPFTQLIAAQKALVEEAVRAITSEY